MILHTAYIVKKKQIVLRTRHTFFLYKVTFEAIGHPELLHVQKSCPIFIVYYLSKNELDYSDKQYNTWRGTLSSMAFIWL